MINGAMYWRAPRVTTRTFVRVPRQLCSLPDLVAFRVISGPFMSYARDAESSPAETSLACEGSGHIPPFTCGNAAQSVSRADCCAAVRIRLTVASARHHTLGLLRSSGRSIQQSRRAEQTRRACRARTPERLDSASAIDTRIARRQLGADQPGSCLARGKREPAETMANPETDPRAGNRASGPACMLAVPSSVALFVRSRGCIRRRLS